MRKMHVMCIATLLTTANLFGANVVTEDDPNLKKLKSIHQEQIDLARNNINNIKISIENRELKKRTKSSIIKKIDRESKKLNRRIQQAYFTTEGRIKSYILEIQAELDKFKTDAKNKINQTISEIEKEYGISIKEEVSLEIPDISDYIAKEKTIPEIDNALTPLPAPEPVPEVPISPAA